MYPWWKDIQKSPLALCWMLHFSPWEEQIEKQIHMKSDEFFFYKTTLERHVYYIHVSMT